MRPGVEAVSRPVFRRFRHSLPAWNSSGRYLAGVLALAGGYYGAAKLGFELEFSGPVAAVVWLPAGVGIAFLCLGGLRFWPGVLLGSCHDGTSRSARLTHPPTRPHANGRAGPPQRN